MRGEGVRHPTTFVKKRLPPSSVPFYLLSLNLLVFVMDKYPKFGRAIYQKWQMHFDLIWF
jgi:hypothetical protein